MTDPICVISLTAMWISLGIAALFLLWQTQKRLSDYFEAMRPVPFPQGQRLGWSEENPSGLLRGVAKAFSSRRLFLRLFLWGAPPLPHSAAALESLARYRRWNLIAGLPLVVFLGAVISLGSAGFVILTVFAMNLLMLRPWPWTEKKA